MKIISHSRALYSTWTFFPEFDLMIDCGEGAATGLGGKTNSVRHLAITHFDFDHVAGIAQFLHLRQRMERNVPLHIYLPATSPRFFGMLGLITKGVLHDNIHIRFMREPAGADNYLRADIGGGRTLHAVDNRHCEDSVGYLVSHLRNKLKPEYQGIPGSQLAELKKQGTVVMDDFRHVLLGYTGDTPPMHLSEQLMYTNADVLVTEATFLNEKDMGLEQDEQPVHQTLAQALGLGTYCQAKELVLNHFSPRYKDHEIKDALAVNNFKGRAIIGPHIYTYE